MKARTEILCILEAGCFLQRCVLESNDYYVTAFGVQLLRPASSLDLFNDVFPAYYVVPTQRHFLRSFLKYFIIFLAFTPS
jgi:hypothetical protein